MLFFVSAKCLNFGSVVESAFETNKVWDARYPSQWQPVAVDLVEELDIALVDRVSCTHETPMSRMR